MEIECKRIWPNDQCTTGTVEIDGRSFCFLLEDVVRQQEGVPVEMWKIPGKTAIPRGRYKTVLDFSNRFQKITAHLLNVPGFTGIRIHGGNHASDTSGCLLFGAKRYDDYTVGESAEVIQELISEIEQAVANNEEVWTTVS